MGTQTLRNWWSDKKEIETKTAHTPVNIQERIGFFFSFQYTVSTKEKELLNLKATAIQ